MTIKILVEWIAMLAEFADGLRDEAIRLGADPADLENQIEDARKVREAATARARAGDLAEFPDGE